MALALLRPGGDTRPARLLREAAILQAPAGEWLDRLIEALGVPPEDRPARRREARQRAEEAMNRARALGLGLVTCLSADYPPWLAQIPDPPPALWLAGDAGALRRTAVAIVGSRDASPAGLAASRRLGRDLARSGVVVVSGLARGIDAAAHEGCLEGGGVTVAVLGGGLNRLYPHEHHTLAEAIRTRGALVTEQPPDTPPLPLHFPRRNRIISGLSRAVVVVEAAERSGSLITAKAALEQGRDVLAVPGGIASGRHRGCHALIKDGARLVETVNDVLEEIGWVGPATSAGADSGKLPVISYLQEAMAGEAVCTLDELVERVARPAPAILAELATLELSGHVRRIGGGHFVWIDGPVMDR
ncbi:MAG: DNA-processing protein DprA [Vicinamibacterales bacterium]